MDVELSPGLVTSLDIAKRGPRGTGWSISQEQADELIAKYMLDVEDDETSMAEKKVASFEYEGEPMRLELRWSGGFTVYRE